MKNLITCLFALIIIGCNSSDDEVQFQNDLQSGITESEFNRIMDIINSEDTKLNDNSLNKGYTNKEPNESDNANNGVYFVPIYSNNVFNRIWYIFWAIPNSNLEVIVDFPQNGDDRAIVFSENEFMANYTIQGPRVFIWDKANREVKYSNFCDENKTGVYSMRWKAEYLPIDQDQDGETDIYLWGQKWQSTDKNGRMHVRTTLTDAHSFRGNCPMPTKEVEFSFVLQTHNETPRVEAVIDGVKYSL